MANKYATMRETTGKKFLTFTYMWTGKRTPEFVSLPDGKKVKVSNMRNETIILENGSSGHYQRFKDDNTTNERGIVIDLEIE